VLHRVHAHVALIVLPFGLERIAEQTSGNTWRYIRDDRNGIKLAQLSRPNGMVWQGTERRRHAQAFEKSQYSEALVLQRP
jgi:hypothetical protein